MITRINHVMVTIPKGEEEQARAFYCGVLGLQELPKPDSLGGRGGLWLIVGDQELHIGVEDQPGGVGKKSHIAYQVEDLAAVKAKLIVQGIEIGDSIPIPGYERFEARDPFGNRIEFIQPV